MKTIWRHIFEWFVALSTFVVGFSAFMFVIGLICYLVEKAAEKYLVVSHIGLWIGRGILIAILVFGFITIVWMVKNIIFEKDKLG